MRSWIFAVVLSVIAMAPILYVVYSFSTGYIEQKPSIATVQFQQRPRNVKLEPGAMLEVYSCEVVDGYKFNLYLEGNRWIEAHLPVATKDEAIPFVIEALNTATPPPPTVTLLRKVGDYWIVDFYLTHDGTRSSMVELLRSKELLLD